MGVYKLVFKESGDFNRLTYREIAIISGIILGMTTNGTTVRDNVNEGGHEWEIVVSGKNDMDAILNKVSWCYRQRGTFDYKR